MIPGHSRIRPKKSLGQHFLVDPQVAQRIAEASGVGPDDLVIEIGPGKGALTSFLLQRAGTVVGIELDRGLCEALSARFASAAGFHLLNADALKADFAALLRRHGACDAVVVGNLPYNIATPIILRLVSDCRGLRKAVVMVQREVARRIVADPGPKDYGSLSIAVQVAATPRRLFDVGHDAFRPVPRVESTVLEIDLGRPASPVAEAVRQTFFEVVRWTFGHRRKMLRGTLRTLPGHPLDPSQMDEVASRSGFDLRRRPETFTIGDFEKLARVIQQVGGDRVRKSKSRDEGGADP